MSQGNKYETRGSRVPEKEGASPRGRRRPKTLCPRLAPGPAGISTHLLCFLVFSLHCGRLAAPCPPQNQQPTLLLESRRRIGGKIIKILHCMQEPALSQNTAEKEQRVTYLRVETPFTLTAGRAKQQ